MKNFWNLVASLLQLAAGVLFVLASFTDIGLIQKLALLIISPFLLGNSFVYYNIYKKNKKETKDKNKEA